MKANIKSNIQSTSSILAVLALIALCGTTRADLTVSNSSNISSWNQVNGQNPFYVSLSSESSATTSQGQPSLGSGATYTVLSETFSITNGAGSLANANTNYVLTGVAILGGSEPPGTSIHLFDVTSNLTSNNGSPLQGSGATYNFTLNGDLFGGGKGLTLTNQFSGESNILYSLSSGPNSQDQAVLGANHTYAFEIWTPAAYNSAGIWYRSSNADPGGQAMGSHDAGFTVARLTITSLGLAGGAPRTFAMALYGAMTSAALTVNTNLVAGTNYVIDEFNPTNTNPYIPYIGTNTYDLGQITNVWTVWFGNAVTNVVWDSANDANGNPNSGSMLITAVFNNGGQYAVYDGFNGINPPLSCYYNGITSFQCDIRFDAGSATTVNSGTGTTNYGHLQIGCRQGTGQDFWASEEIPVGTTNWVHVTIPLSLVNDTNLIAINDVAFKIDGGWYGSNPMNGISTLRVDNVKFVGPSSFTLPPAPTLSIQPARPGLRLFAGSTVNTYDRVELATVDQNQSWINRTPVSYSFTLLDYPANIDQTHIFLIPVNSSGGNSMYNNEYIDYQAANAVWLDIQPYANGQVTASVLWKTNLPNSNPNNTLVLLTNSTAIGTWTLKFTSNSHGTVTAPGGNSAPFTITDANIATDFTNPLVAYFGLEPNSGTGIGEYEDWGSVSVSGVSGVNENDNFTTDSSFNSSLWNINTLTVALQTCVQLATTNTPYWVNWTLPAVNYGLGTSSAITGSSNTPYPWMLPEYFNFYNDGNNIPGQAAQGYSTWVLVPWTCLPTVNGSQGGTPSPVGFFELFNPPLAN